MMIFWMRKMHQKLVCFVALLFFSACYIVTIADNACLNIDFALYFKVIDTQMLVVFQALKVFVCFRHLTFKVGTSSKKKVEGTKRAK